MLCYITEGKRAKLKKYYVIENCFKEVQSLAHIGNWEYNAIKDKLFWSDELYLIFGIDKNVRPLTIEGLLQRIHPKDRDIIRKQVEKGENYRSDYSIVMDDGSEKYLHEDVIILRDKDGKIIKMRGTAQDITQHKNDQEQIKASLKEKDVLLSEIHHRAKNNMQVVISLFRLQSSKAKNKQLTDMLKESENRILSMALVHELLYQSRDFSSLDFGVYISNLVNDLFISLGVDTNKIKLNIDFVDTLLDLENAIPCGLIINELVSNSLKHAFLNKGECKIDISMFPVNEDEFGLTISDNGVGIPIDMDVQNTESMGLNLVKVLVEGTFEGKMELDRKNGTKFYFNLKKVKYKSRI